MQIRTLADNGYRLLEQQDSVGYFTTSFETLFTYEFGTDFKKN